MTVSNLLPFSTKKVSPIISSLSSSSLSSITRSTKKTIDDFDGTAIDTCYVSMQDDHNEEKEEQKQAETGGVKKGITLQRFYNTYKQKENGIVITLSKYHSNSGKIISTTSTTKTKLIVTSTMNNIIGENPSPLELYPHHHPHHPHSNQPSTATSASTGLDTTGNMLGNHSNNIVNTTDFNKAKAKDHRVLTNPLVLSILITETAERVAYFGFRAVLVLYFTNGLQFSDSTSVSLCSGTIALAYLSPLVGAVLGDSIWGRFLTIWRFGIMYTVGLIFLTTAAYQLPINLSMNDYSDNADTDNTDVDIDTTDVDIDTTESINLFLPRLLTIIGLFFVCSGTGGIKPCVSAFGADQIVLADTADDDTDNSNNNNRDDDDNDDEKEDPRIREYFNSFYFCINAGALFSFGIIPIVRANYGFGAAYLIPTIFMIVALLVFVSQRRHYKHRHTGGSCNNKEENKNYATTTTTTTTPHNTYTDDGYIDTNIPNKQQSIEEEVESNIQQEPPSSPTLFEIFQVCYKILYHRFYYRTSFGKYICHYFCCCVSNQHINTSISSSNGQQQQQQQQQPFEDEPTIIIDNDDEQEDLQQQLTNMTTVKPTLNGNTESYGNDNDNHNEEERVQQYRHRQGQVYQDAQQALHILPLLLFYPIFWMLYDQMGSVWVLQATKLNLHTLQPEQLNVLNPLEILIFIPLFDRIIYPFLERRYEQNQFPYLNIQPVRRMEYGMFLTGISFLTSMWLELAIIYNEHNNKDESSSSSSSSSLISVTWQIPQITIITIAEILLNVTGLEFAYSQAPANMQALILAIYLFMTAIGNGLGSFLYATIFAYMSTWLSMLLCSICMFINLYYFSKVAHTWKPYQRRRTMDDDTIDHTKHNFNNNDDNGYRHRHRHRSGNYHSLQKNDNDDDNYKYKDDVVDDDSKGMVEMGQLS